MPVVDAVAVDCGVKVGGRVAVAGGGVAGKGLTINVDVGSGFPLDGAAGLGEIVVGAALAVTVSPMKSGNTLMAFSVGVGSAEKRGLIGPEISFVALSGTKAIVCVRVLLATFAVAIKLRVLTMPGLINSADKHANRIGITVNAPISTANMAVSGTFLLYGVVAPDSRVETRSNTSRRVNHPPVRTDSAELNCGATWV
jgi:hypothetical protein